MALRAFGLKPIAGLAAAWGLGPALLVANSDGIAAIFPAATSLLLFVVAICHDRAPLDRRIIGWFWLWGACCFANRALRDAGWATWPVEWALLALVLPLAGRLVWRLLREPGPSMMRWPAAAVSVVAVVAFAWPASATGPLAIDLGSTFIYGVPCGVAILSLFAFPNK